AVFRIIGAIDPGLGRVGLGTVPPLGGDGDCQFFFRSFAGGIKVENPLAGVADDYSLAAAYLVIRLGTKHYLASHALLAANFRQPSLTEFDDAIIVLQQVRRNTAAVLVAFSLPFGEFFLVLRCPPACFLFFFFDLSRLGLQICFRRLHLLLAALGIDHQLKNLVFRAADLLVGKVDFVLQGAVLVVGFDVQHLVAVLGDFLLQILDARFIFAPGSIVGFDGGFRLIENCFRARELFFDGRYAFGQRGYFLVEAQDFTIGFLEFEKVL